MADIHSPDLFSAARKHLADIDGIELTLVGVPVWIHADSHSLLLAIEYLVRTLARHTGQRQFDIEVVQGERRAYLEIVWAGEAIPSATLESWLDEPLKGTIASRTVRQIVERHGSELWSKARAGGLASIRLPLQLADRVQSASVRVAPRPEYYDFDLFNVSDKALADIPLRHMRYVVFDTETTGLKPSDGDELISIGAVRIVNGRILTGETFERLIDPGRSIPETSTRIHGITSEMVKGKPPARIVLPQFKAYVADSVLIAYNAAFDMKFLELKQEEAGVRFDNPVLDALLLSIYLYKDAPDHSLNGMASQLGIEISGRHTAVGDAMATAALWVRLLELLDERGIRTFGEAAAISSRMLEERKLHLRF
jgi:DNA polymerase-3 subunit epsilon